MSKAKAQAIKEEEENQKYYKPFLSEVGKKLKSFEEEWDLAVAYSYQM